VDPVASAKARPADVERRIQAKLDRGDLREAATEAIRGYGPQILGYLASVLRDVDTAYDVFAQFSEDLWKGLPAFRRECSFRTWTYTLAWNAAKRHANEAYHRRVRRLHTTEISEVAQEVCASTLPHLRDLASRLREGLDPDEQTLLILRVDKGLSWKEVVHVMSELDHPPDEATLRKRFERVKEKLRRSAEAQGLIRAADGASQRQGGGSAAPRVKRRPRSP
jgi:RNA polymerase sigma-70 factor (ECF subfamily)